MAVINSIPASQIVGITPSVVSGGGAGLELIALMLTNSNRVPIGQILSFPSSLSVSAFFGAASLEYQEALVYFAGFIGGNVLPGALLVAQYPVTSVGAWLRGANISALTLTQLQALGGILTVTIDGTLHTSSAITLTGATSFSAAANLITTALGTTGPTQATITGSIGATFTGTGSGTNLTTTAVSGVISAGDVITGTGITGTVTIVSQTSGITGGAGVYVTSAATTSTAAAIVGTSNQLQATAVISGTLAIGQAITGTGIASGTFISAFVTGTGNTGIYTISAAMQVASEAITVVLPTVSYDSVSGAFLVSSGTTGAASTISFGGGSIATALGLTLAAGAVNSQGAVAAVPSVFMASVVSQTTNFASFFTIFDPDNGSGNTQKLLFAAWNTTQNNSYLYIAKDTDVTPTLSSAATSSLGYILKLNATSGCSPIFQPAGAEMFHSAFLAGFIASIDFTEFNGRATAAFKGQAGLALGVTNATVAANLQANGYNYYADFATANQLFQWFMPGSVSGAYNWIDSYVNQIWLSSQLQLALMEMLNTYKSIPYNPAGYGIIRSALLDPILAAINFGAIRQNVPLSAAQANFVNNSSAVSQPIDGILSTQGWYLQILPATAQIRAGRKSPPCTLWYMDGESVQSIQLASVLMQ